MGLSLVGQAFAQERRIALVIGNSAYGAARPLTNPVNDARAIAEKLTRLGFEVDKRENVSLREMTRAVTAFGERLRLRRGSNVGLFYYAGHGLQVDGRNYLVPVDAEITSSYSVRSEAMDVDTVLGQFSGLPDAINVVILDACRNNPFEERLRGMTGNGLAAIDAPKGTLIAYATAPGKTASDGDRDNGLYTASLVKNIDAPQLRIEDVFKRVRAEVAQESSQSQIPWESSSITGDFYFVPKVPAPAITAQPSAPVEAQYELAFWDAIRGSTDPRDFQDYLQQYPRGKFTSLAMRRIEVLTASLAKPPPPVPSRPIASTQPPVPAQPSAPVPPPSPIVEPMDREMMVMRRAALRDAPRADGKAVGSVEAGNRIRVMGKVKGETWYLARFGRSEGYVAADQVMELAAAEEAEWRRSKDSAAIETVTGFLSRYPNGTYATEAKAKLAGLRAAAAKLEQEKADQERRTAEVRAEEERRQQSAAASRSQPAAISAPPPSNAITELKVARTCRADSSVVPSKITVSNEGGWCWLQLSAVWVRMQYAPNFRVARAPAHGELVMGEVNDKRTRLAYKPHPGFVGTDSYEVVNKMSGVGRTVEINVTN